VWRQPPVACVAGSLKLTGAMAKERLAGIVKFKIAVVHGFAPLHLAISLSTLSKPTAYISIQSGCLGAAATK